MNWRFSGLEPWKFSKKKSYNIKNIGTGNEAQIYSSNISGGNICYKVHKNENRLTEHFTVDSVVRCWTQTTVALATNDVHTGSAILARTMKYTITNIPCKKIGKKRTVVIDTETITIE